jgi:hypothetical protein
MVWGEPSSGHYHLKFSYSKDQGKTWSTVREIESTMGPEINQFRHALAVNNDGTVGISWFDTRDVGDRRAYHEYFAASVDGGESFLPPVRVSSEESALDAPGNTMLKPTIDSPRAGADGVVHFYFDDTSERFPDGGDYTGLTADADGRFHPFWTDTRRGNFQAWTATVLVKSGRDKVSQSTGEAGSGIPTPLAGKLQPIFDPANYDRQTGIEEIPVRWKNISESVICKPIRVQIKDPGGAAESGATKAPQVLLNADNGKQWGGAVFDYSRSLGDFGCLEPGEVSGAILLRIKVADPANAFVSFDVEVTGVEVPRRH